MENVLILIAILVIAVSLTKDFSKEKKPPSGNCRNCPEYRYCGGGRSRCARRNETMK